MPNVTIQYPGSRSPLFSPTEADAPQALGRITVLFADVAGSPQYLKSHSHRDGRMMLERHRRKVAETVIAYGGQVLKIVESSLMACFNDLKQAVEAAVNIQSTFRQYNSASGSDKEIHIRIGLHYGEGRVEKNDILGGVANTAAKILATTAKHQIHVSHSVYTRLQNEAPFTFIPLQGGANRAVSAGLRLYRVSWEKAARTAGSKNGLLCIRPLWRLGQTEFRPVWKEMLAQKPWGKQALSEVIDSQNGLTLIFDHCETALEAAKAVTAFFYNKLGPSDGYAFVPVQMVIDAGVYHQSQQDQARPQNIDWETIDPGVIHISSIGLNEIEGRSDDEDADEDNSQEEVVYHRADEVASLADQTPLFLFQNNLLKAGDSRCFYCGDGRHHSRNCPSKNGEANSSALDQLSYLSLKSLNDLFLGELRELSAGGDGATLADDDSPRDYSQAMTAVLELKRVYQLPFLKLLWNSAETRWDQLKKSPILGAKGGNLWLAFDCIRVNNIAEAEKLLQNCLEYYPKDYRVYALWGFIKIENDQYRAALDYFQRAYQYAEQTPQKIWLLLLQERLYGFVDDWQSAVKSLQQIYNLDRRCPEVRYQTILRQFARHEYFLAVQELRQLIESDPIYFMYGLMDPELGPFNRHIHPMLLGLKQTVLRRVRDILPKAEQAHARVCHLFGPETTEGSELDNQWEHVTELLGSQSYLGYLHVMESASAIVSKSNRLITRRKRSLQHSLDGIYQQCSQNFDVLETLPQIEYVARMRKASRRLEGQAYGVENAIKANKTGILEDGPVELNRIKKELSPITFRVQIWLWLKEMRTVAAFFLKRFVLFQAINLAAGFVLLPIVLRTVAKLQPRFVSLLQNLDTYRATCLILCGLAGLLAAFYLTVKFQNTENKPSKQP